MLGIYDGNARQSHSLRPARKQIMTTTRKSGAFYAVSVRKWRTVTKWFVTSRARRNDAHHVREPVEIVVEIGRDHGETGIGLESAGDEVAAEVC